MSREDRFTNTPEDAAAFERRYGAYVDHTEPDLSDVAEPYYEEIDLEEPQPLLEAQMDAEQYADE